MSGSAGVFRRAHRLLFWSETTPASKEVEGLQEIQDGSTKIRKQADIIDKAAATGTQKLQSSCETPKRRSSPSK